MESPTAELVFVVRLWRGHGDAPDGTAWRGAIVEVQSGKRFYVAGTRDIADFIDARLAERKLRDSGT
jgi:hypothetical protein